MSGSDCLWSRLCKNSNDRRQSINFSEFSAVFCHYRLSEVKVRIRCAVFRQFPSFHTAWVESGTPKPWVLTIVTSCVNVVAPDNTGFANALSRLRKKAEIVAKILPIIGVA